MWAHLDNPNSYSKPGVFYNNSDLSSVLSNMNFAQVQKLQGYHFEEQYDGAFYPYYWAGSFPGSAGNPTRFPVIENGLPPKGHTSAITTGNPPFGNYRNVLKTEYVRIHCPKYGFANSYFFYEGEPPALEAAREAHNQFGPHFPFPTFTGVELNSLDSKRFAFDTGSSIGINQNITFTYTRPTGQRQTINYLPSQSSYNNRNFNHYDVVESQGKTTVDTGVTFTIYSPEGTAVQVGARFYVFFYGGDLYISFKPEIYPIDPEVVIDWDVNISITTFSYPVQPYGFPTIPQYSRDGGYGSYAFYFPYASTHRASDANRFWSGLAGRQRIGDKDIMGREIATPYNYIPFLRVYPMTEEKFFEIEREAYNSLNPGT